MEHSDWLSIEAERSLKRLIPRISPHISKDKDIFLKRLDEHWYKIFSLLHGIYGSYYDFFYHLETVLVTMAQMHSVRPKDLKKLDAQREANKDWFQSEKMMGGVCYVDLFADNLQGIREKIPYFKELGLTYLHLMPLFKAPEPNSDGGYAISDYRSVNPKLGTMEDLAELASEFRKNGISLVLDFVFNHTSDEHDWALKALAGDKEYQQYYYIFPNRDIPDQYERTLREIFPEQAPGNFTYRSEVDMWVWTTFREFQWDLNYSNPAVFNAMLGELLYLANQGIEVIRLDAVAFIWKQMGTTCENLPQAHQIIRAYNAIVKVVAPCMLFKSEAIVHPDMVASYISEEEAPLSYHPTMMALLWESLATRDVTLLSYSMQKRFKLPKHCAWVNYVRVHDDIGWTFADEDAQDVGINGYWHRQFLNKFYIGEFQGSFAKGVPFNYNPVNQDMRISGMGSSLVGVESALKSGNNEHLDHALKRFLLIHSVIISAGGIPLLYFGDEIATLNDYNYVNVEGKKDDSRWVHRPKFDWSRAANRDNVETTEGWMFTNLVKLIEIRKSQSAFGNVDTEFFGTQNKHVLAYVVGGEILVFANFSEHPQTIDRQYLQTHTQSKKVTDLISKKSLVVGEEIKLAPYQFLWLQINK
jgi:amylosucrase